MALGIAVRHPIGRRRCDRMKRREFIAGLGSAAAAWPITARAQQAVMPIVGFLNGASMPGYSKMVAAFRRGLAEAGYVEGRNVVVNYRWAEGNYERLPGLAAELVRQQVDVIVANGPAAVVAKKATATIPIVFSTTFDPVRLGLVASLNRPNGNLTGVTNLGVEVGPKRLGLLHESVPGVSTVALLVNPASPAAETQSQEVRAAAHSLGLFLHVLSANNEHEFDAIFASLIRAGAGALMISADPFFTSQSERLAALALRHALPAIYQYREFAAAGGLMSYGGPSPTDNYRLVGLYTGRILKGEKPGDLPVEQTTKVAFIINLKTAKALGLEISPTLLALADEVIE